MEADEAEDREEAVDEEPESRRRWIETSSAARAAIAIDARASGRWSKEKVEVTA
jgi:hypothetical protein